MFKLAVSETYSIPVVVDFPADGGRVQKQQFDAVVRRLTKDELKDLFERGWDDEQVVRHVMVGWKGVADREGVEIPFSQDSLTELLALHPTQPSIVRAFLASIQGQRAKN